jgi:hypothetical protein
MSTKNEKAEDKIFELGGTLKVGHAWAFASFQTNQQAKMFYEYLGNMWGAKGKSRARSGEPAIVSFKWLR